MDPDKNRVDQPTSASHHPACGHPLQAAIESSTGANRDNGEGVPCLPVRSVLRALCGLLIKLPPLPPAVLISGLRFQRDSLGVSLPNRP